MKHFIAFDVGANSIKCSKWEKSIKDNLRSSAIQVRDDAGQYSSMMTVSIKKGKYQVCSYATPDYKKSILTYIWDFLNVIGDHSRIKDLNKEKEENRQRSTLTLTDDRAYYDLVVNKDPVKIDAEVAMSLIFEYMFYINNKDDKSLYENVFKISQEGAEKYYPILCNIPSYATKSYVRGLQVALDCKSLGEAIFVPDFVAVCVDYSYHRNLDHEFNKTPETVLFVYMNESYTSCTLATFKENFISIIDHSYMMLGGNDFIAAIYTMIKGFKTVDLTSCANLKREKMERQFWEKAIEVTNTFSLEGVDLCGIDIENLVNNTDDMFFNFDIKPDEVEECWFSLYEEYRSFVGKFIEKHKEDKITSCEIVGNSLRIPALKNILNEHLQQIHIDHYSNTMNMDNAVNRGLAFIGNSVYDNEPDQVMDLSRQSISLEYSIENNKKKKKLTILGCDPMKPEAGKLVVSLENKCYTLEEGKDHNWSGILEDFRKISFLMPNVSTSPTEAIGDDDEVDEVDTGRKEERNEVIKGRKEERNEVIKGRKEGRNEVIKGRKEGRNEVIKGKKEGDDEVDEVVKEENDEEEVDEVVTLESNSLNQHGESSFFQQPAVLSKDDISPVSNYSDEVDSVSNYQDNISQASDNEAVDNHIPGSFNSYSRKSTGRNSIIGSLYSTVQDESTVIEISGTYQIHASKEKERRPIQHCESKKVYGFAFTENYELSGEYKLYFDENQMILKEEGTFVNNRRNGEFKYYYNNEKHSVRMKRHYNDNKLSGYVISYTEDGQYETIAWYGDYSDERKRWEYNSGFLKRYSERDDMNLKRWKVVEFDASHYVKAIGFASRNLKDNKYTYTMSGNCYLYATNKYQMHGFYQNDEITIDEMTERNTYNVEDCYKAIIKVDGKKLKFRCKDNQYPWKKIPTDIKKEKKGKDHHQPNISFMINGHKQLFSETKEDEEKSITKLYSILGYLWMKIERKKGSYSETEYYPFFEDRKEYKTELFTIHPSMKEICDHSVVASYKEYSKEEKCIKEEKYSNVGIKL